MTMPGDEPTYEDLRITLRPASASGAFHATGEAGQDTAEGDFTLSLSAATVKAALEQARATTTGSRTGGAGGTDPLRDVGTELYKQIFEGPIGRVYEAARLRAAAPDRLGIRLRLVAEGTASALPLEFLYDVKTDTWLGLSSKATLSRQLPGPPVAPAPTVGRPLRVVLYSKGASLREERALLEAIGQDPGALAVNVLEGADAAALGAALAAGCDVLHCVGGGDSRGRGTAGELTASDVGALLPPDLPLLLLDAGGSGTVAEELASRASAVLGYRGSPAADARRVFVGQLYRSLLTGAALDVAVAAARQELAARRPSGREWGLAVLYARDPGARVVRPPATNVESPLDNLWGDDAKIGSPDAYLRALHQANISALEALLAQLGDGAPAFLVEQLDLEREQESRHRPLTAPPL